MIEIIGAGTSLERLENIEYVNIFSLKKGGGVRVIILEYFALSHKKNPTILTCIHVWILFIFLRKGNQILRGRDTETKCRADTEGKTI